MVHDFRNPSIFTPIVRLFGLFDYGISPSHELDIFLGGLYGWEHVQMRRMAVEQPKLFHIEAVKNFRTGLVSDIAESTVPGCANLLSYAPGLALMALAQNLVMGFQLDNQGSTVVNNQKEGEHMEPSIRPEELKKILEKGSVLLLDVRRKTDHDADPETIPGASWRNPEQVDVWGQEIPKGQRVVVYCVKGGSVSQSITETLIKQEIRACYVEGGLKAWKESG